jgi:hypothetical protein
LNLPQPTFVNYFQVVGPSRCASCEYVTDGSKSYAEQERDFREHFNANHAEKYGFRLGTTAFFVQTAPQPTADAPKPELLGALVIALKCLKRCSDELAYVQAVEGDGHELCASGEGKEAIEEAEEILWANRYLTGPL